MSVRDGDRTDGGPSVRIRLRCVARRVALPLGLLVWAGAPAVVAAHELEEASATLTIRSGGHVALRLQVPWAELLRTTVAPGRPMVDLLGQLASEPAAAFARRYATLTNRLAVGTRLLSSAGTGIAFTRWHWPEAAIVQQALRDELMSRLVDGAAFRHASRLAAEAEATVPAPIPAVRLGLPPQLGPALVTVVRPEEQWVGRGGLSTAIDLRSPTPTRR